MVQWPQTITVSINSDVVYPFDAIRQAFRCWEAVADVTFREDDDALWRVARLDDVKAAFGVHPEADALAVWSYDTVTSEGVGGHIGLSGHIASDPVRVAAHEIGHLFGLFPDRPGASPADTLYSYAVIPEGSGPEWQGPQADDIEVIQAALGASRRDDVIHAGHGSGVVSGGMGDDEIFANRGDDIVYGNWGDDSLHGGQGSDALYGGRGDDYLAGNRGDDTMAGNAGGDVFDLSGGGDDVILDFTAADRLRVDGEVSNTGTDAGLLVTHDGGTVLLVGVGEWSPDFII